MAERDDRLRGWVGAALMARWLAQLNCELQRSMWDASQAAWGATGRLRAQGEEAGPLICAALGFARQ